MDILGVHTVVNFDCPVSRSDYVHRVGRTGRAGHAGRCVTLYTEEDFPSLHMVASAMAASGSDAPQWMLDMPRKRGAGGGKGRNIPPKRADLIQNAKGKRDRDKAKFVSNKGRKKAAAKVAKGKGE